MGWQAASEVVEAPGYVRTLLSKQGGARKEYPGSSLLLPPSLLLVPLIGQTQVEAWKLRSLVGAVQEDQLPGHRAEQEESGGIHLQEQTEKSQHSVLEIVPHKYR